LVVAAHQRETFRIGWRWPLAFVFFSFAVIGLSVGVSLTERPDVGAAGFLTKAYYSLGLFVVGGLDVGIPTEGPLWGRVLLWIAYFGAPLLAASAVVEAVLSAMSKQRWRLRRMKNHIVIVGAGDLTTSYLRVLRSSDQKTRVIVVDIQIEAVRRLELSESFGVTVIVGDITHEFLLRELRLHRARRVMLFGDDDFLSFEAASKILRLHPRLKGQVVIHCTSLRFLRAMSDTRIAQQTIRFNSYNLAAKGLVQDTLLQHFRNTAGKDTVVLAGFGLFGQTILEELQADAPEQIARVALIDVDVNRRIEIVDDQQRVSNGYERHVLQGDIAHPQVWRDLEKLIDLKPGAPVVILGTGDAANNLRTALWLKQKYANAMIFPRTNDISEFAQEVGRDYDISCISITHLVEEHIPQAWLT
jgi:hypothetical protein